MEGRTSDPLAELLARPIAHRGLHACGAPGPVENTISAAQAAIARGYGIECDVQLSADGEPVVFHDETLERLTGKPGRVHDLDAASLSRLRLRGARDCIPTLAAFLGAIAGRAPLVIEIKSRDDGDLRLTVRTIDLLSSYKGPVALESFDPAVVACCKSLDVSYPIGLVGPLDDGIAPSREMLAACDFLSWSIDDLQRVSALSPPLPCSTWTVRTSADVERARQYGAQIVFEGFDPHH